MRVPDDRPRPGLVDCLIVLGSIALGVWAARAEPAGLEQALGLGNTQAAFEAEMGRSLKARAAELAADTSLKGRVNAWRWPVLSYWCKVMPFLTLGAAAATFRHRDQRSRRALRRIGVLTTSVAGAFVAVCLVNEFALRRMSPILGHRGYLHNRFDSIWGDLAVETSLALTALWVVLAMGRRWRTAPSWTDRLGRLVGAGWITFAVLAVLLQYVLMPS